MPKETALIRSLQPKGGRKETHECLPENALEHLPLCPPPPAAKINRRRNCSDSKKGLKRRYQNTHKGNVEFILEHVAEKRSCMRRYQNTLPVSEMAEV